MTAPNPIDYTTYTGAVKTRDGMPVRIICRDRSGPYPIVAMGLGEDQDEWIRCFPRNGLWRGVAGCSNDLLPVPKPRVKRHRPIPTGK